MERSDRERLAHAQGEVTTLKRQVREGNAAIIYCLAIGLGALAMAFGLYMALPVIFVAAIIIDHVTNA